MIGSGVLRRLFFESSLTGLEWSPHHIMFIRCRALIPAPFFFWVFFSPLFFIVKYMGKKTVMSVFIFGAPGGWLLPSVSLEGAGLCSRLSGALFCGPLVPSTRPVRVARRQVSSLQIIMQHCQEWRMLC